MRRVTDVTKEIPVSLHVSCSIFSNRLLGDEKAADEAFQGNGAAYTDSCGQPTFPLIKQIHRITVLPGIRPKELGSTPGSVKQRQGNYKIERRKSIFTLPFKIDEKEQC